jgi:threonine/homoserine/homoserine lactone efflux protein
MTLESLVAMAAALAILAITPGPGVLAVISRAVGHGFADAAVMTLGIVLGDLVFFTAALTGWAAVAQAFGGVFEAVRLIAALALLAMGARMVRASFRRETAAAHATQLGSVKRRAFASGFLLTLGNPKAILFYLAFLPTFVDLARMDAVDALAVVAVIVAVVGSVLLGYAALAARAARCLSRPAFARWMLRGAGALLIGTGAAVAVRS